MKVCCANMCYELKAMFYNTEQSILYKTIYKQLFFLHTSKGWSWLNGEINDNPYYLHSMFCLLQSAMTAITTCLCKKEDILSRLQKGKTIFSPSCTTSACNAGANFVNNLIIESEQPAAGHTNKPKTYDWFKYGTGQLQQHTQEEPIFKPPSKCNKLAEKDNYTSCTPSTAQGGRTPTRPNQGWSPNTPGQ